MKTGLSRFSNFIYKHTLRYVSNQNIEFSRKSISKLFYIPAWNKLSDMRTFDAVRMRTMTLKYIVNDDDFLPFEYSKDVLANHLTINMSTDGRLSAYSRDEW